MSQDPTDQSRRKFLATSTVLGAAGALWSALPFTDSAHAALFRRSHERRPHLVQWQVAHR
ncbi:twin-arginine translocation signal domain-containing protein [Pseudomonas sp. PONIH3]|uniref:twin-arginine translocation signal domain-containing protein n=1 Tax=Pseudomonas sp. PONIH3 TaxID=1636610 RepID=UPI003D285CE4